MRNTEVALQAESQQRELAMSMAREVATGQVAVFQQFDHQVERDTVEHTAEVGRISYVLLDVDRKVGLLEDILRGAH